MNRAQRLFIAEMLGLYLTGHYSEVAKNPRYNVVAYNTGPSTFKWTLDFIARFIFEEDEDDRYVWRDPPLIF